MCSLPGVTSWPEFFYDPSYGPTPSYFLDDKHSGQLLDRLFADPFACYTQKHEWITQDGDEKGVEFNYCEVFRCEVLHQDPDGFKRAMTLILDDVCAAILHGKRHLDDANPGNLCSYMGGIGTLGITEHNARLGILRSMRLLSYAQDQRVELLCELTLDPNRTP